MFVLCKLAHNVGKDYTDDVLEREREREREREMNAFSPGLTSSPPTSAWGTDSPPPAWRAGIKHF